MEDPVNKYMRFDFLIAAMSNNIPSKYKYLKTWELPEVFFLHFLGQQKGSPKFPMGWEKFHAWLCSST